MRHSCCRVLPGLLLVALAGNAAGQVDRNAAAGIARLKPRITSVTYRFGGPGQPVFLTLTGTAFPADQTATKQRLFRLRAPAWGGGAEEVYYVGQPSEIMGSWTSTRVDLMLPVIPYGRTFTIGLVEKDRTGANPGYVLLSNEVHHLIPMDILSTSPGPVPLGATEIVAHTSSTLGPRAGRIVKLGGQQVTVTTWKPEDGAFAFLKPAALVVPSMPELWVESAGGLVVSDKLRVRFLGPEIH